MFVYNNIIQEVNVNCAACLYVLAEGCEHCDAMNLDPTGTGTAIGYDDATLDY